MRNEELFKWVDRELYPTLFNKMDAILPEFDFIRRGNSWQSNNKLKVNGDTGSEKGKVYIYANNPGVIIDYRLDPTSITKYLMRTGRSYIDIITGLSREANLTPPISENYDPEEYESRQRKQTLTELCNSFFISSLHTNKDASDTMEYLKSRGYTVGETKLMEIGYLPSQNELIHHLQTKGYSKDQLEEVIKLDYRLGATHKLTIPFRSGGTLKGFKFRATSPGATPKYINSKDLDVNGGFFNLLSIKGDKDITIVEGELDALNATVKGIDNVVAIGSKSIAKSQIKDAIQRGAKKITICLDTDPGKEEETRSTINRAIDLILEEDFKAVFVANLGTNNGEKNDPDTLIQDKGIEALEEALNGSRVLPYYLYKIEAILQQYGEIEQREKRSLNEKEIEELIDEIVATALTIKDPIHRERYENKFKNAPITEALGITESSINEAIRRLDRAKVEEETLHELEELHRDIKEATSKGDTEEAFRLLKKAQNIETKSRASDSEQLFKPITEEWIIDEILNRPPSLYSGYTIGYDNETGEALPLELPSSAITTIAGPTNHGKTTLLVNLALNVLENHPEKDIYYLSFEETKIDIFMRMLNTYIGKNHPELISNNPRKSIDYYYKNNGDATMFKASKVEDFTRVKDSFMNELILSRRLNIEHKELDCESLCSAIRAIKKDNPRAGAIFIDYIQLINLKSGHKLSRQPEVKEITEQLKRVSIDTGLPIIVGAQFNRQVESLLHLDATKIGEAGDIERASNTIVGMWNNNESPNYGSLTKGDEREIEIYSQPGTIFVQVLKRRNDIKGVKENLIFDGKRGLITNLNSRERAQIDVENGHIRKETPASSWGKPKQEVKPREESKASEALPFEPDK